MAIPSPTSPRKPSGMQQLQKYARLLHRDAGHLFIGLTVVYAVSGIAVNHIEDWDPNVATSERVVQLAAIPEVDSAAKIVGDAFVAVGLSLPADADIYETESSIEVTASGLQVTIHRETLEVRVVETQSRWFLRAANWLHLNRGKAAWTFVADFYAAGLLFLAGSGLILSSGTPSQRRRAVVFAILGVLGPVAFVLASPQSPSAIVR